MAFDLGSLISDAASRGVSLPPEVMQQVNDALSHGLGDDAMQALGQHVSDLLQQVDHDLPFDHPAGDAHSADDAPIPQEVDLQAVHDANSSGPVVDAQPDAAGQDTMHQLDDMMQQMQQIMQQVHDVDVQSVQNIHADAGDSQGVEVAMADGHGAGSDVHDSASTDHGVDTSHDTTPVHDSSLDHGSDAA